MSAASTAAAGADESAARSSGARRRIARLAAVQALYQLELNPGRGPDAVIGEFLHHRLGRDIDGDNYGKADERLFGDLVRGVTEHRERLERLLRLILEAGAYELVHRPDIPPRVTISEYVAIAYAFFSGREPALANGVFDRLARTLRAAEL
jgi:N utilization substance protein B